MLSYVMFIDLNSCSGCHACSVACKAEHDVQEGAFRHTVQYIETGLFPDVSRRFVPSLCQHCEDAPCLEVCSVDAVIRKDTGTVVIDQEQCMGTAVCIEACPYGAIYFDFNKQMADKCDFCEDRRDEQERPACVATCPTDAMMFGEENDPVIKQKIQSGQYQQWEVAETKPRIWYKDLDEQTNRLLTKINKR